MAPPRKKRKEQKGDIFSLVPGDAEEDGLSREAIRQDDLSREEQRRQKRLKKQRQVRQQRKEKKGKGKREKLEHVAAPHVFRVAGVDPGTRNIGVCVTEWTKCPLTGTYSVLPLSVETISLETESAGDEKMVRAVRSLLTCRPDLLEVDALFIEEQPHRVGMNQAGNLKVIVLASVLLGVWSERWERKWQEKARRDLHETRWEAPLLPHFLARMQPGRVKNTFVPPGWSSTRVERVKQCAEREVVTASRKGGLFKRDAAYTSTTQHKINKKFIYMMCTQLFGSSLRQFLRSTGLTKADDFCDAIVHSMAGGQHLLKHGFPSEQEEKEGEKNEGSAGSCGWARALQVAGRGGRSTQDCVSSRWQPGEESRLYFEAPE